MIGKTGFIFAALLWVSAPSVWAAVYKSVDEHGNVVYTDDPVGHGEPLKLPPLSTVPAPKYGATRATAPRERAATAADYEAVRIVAPQADETLRDNTGNVTIKALVQPPLQVAAGDRLQFFLDDQPFGEPSVSAQTLIPNLDRGTHTVSVAVISASGQPTQRSESVRFYLHRQSINFPRGPQSTAPAPTSAPKPVPAPKSTLSR